jgi:hypothetical protein
VVVFLGLQARKYRLPSRRAKAWFGGVSGGFATHCMLHNPGVLHPRTGFGTSGLFRRVVSVVVLTTDAYCLTVDLSSRNPYYNGVCLLGSAASVISNRYNAWTTTETSSMIGPKDGQCWRVRYREKIDRRPASESWLLRDKLGPTVQIYDRRITITKLFFGYACSFAQNSCYHTYRMALHAD